MSTYDGVPCIHEIVACFKSRKDGDYKFLNFNPRWSHAFYDLSNASDELELPKGIEDEEEEKEIELIGCLKNPTKRVKKRGREDFEDQKLFRVDLKKWHLIKSIKGAIAL